MSSEDYSVKLSSDLNISDGGNFHVDTTQALDKLLVHHCVQYNLPNLLDLYLEHHKLARENDSLYLLQEAAVSFLTSSESYRSLILYFALVLSNFCRFI